MMTVYVNIILKALIKEYTYCLTLAFRFCLMAMPSKPMARDMVCMSLYDDASDWYVLKYLWVLLVLSRN